MKRYKVELELELAEEDEAKAVEAARARAAQNGITEAMQPVGSLPGPQIAVMELLRMELFGNSSTPLSEAGIIVTSLSVGEGEDPAAAESNFEVSPEEAELEADLDVVNDYGVYACRWPNGDFSIVASKTKREAIARLDEWGEAIAEMLTPLPECLLDFRLGDSAEITLENMGDETSEAIWESCFPIVNEARASEAARPLFEPGFSDEQREAADQMIRVAVEVERSRLAGEDPEGLPEAE